MEFLTKEPFVYDRQNAPLFFVGPKNEEENRWRQMSLQRVSREYFRLGSRTDTSHMTNMSNGMTLGEYAMQICVDRNIKRKDPTK
jgi:hypothetical protein